ncbi:unnamed protein product [Heligmosomoides polygyrus]|uniref:Secreted protein n=1 Tax=Heligmosomoides polygyrus TaxID=6339 RepID=A0A183G878_HELPZ|nr:unnamed protein product [Heligmosomoides polygyrus]VDP10536.1 unnamed protein product [Heligmosomoides polygyrus]
MALYLLLHQQHVLGALHLIGPYPYKADEMHCFCSWSARSPKCEYTKNLTVAGSRTSVSTLRKCFGKAIIIGFPGMSFGACDVICVRRAIAIL